uniref:Plexin-B1 n=1 Tax=Lygus hesperus TaxID=30085 RepID=A0A0A9YHK4_LYGHE
MSDQSNSSSAIDDEKKRKTARKSNASERKKSVTFDQQTSLIDEENPANIAGHQPLVSEPPPERKIPKDAPPSKPNAHHTEGTYPRFRTRVSLFSTLTSSMRLRKLFYCWDV